MPTEDGLPIENMPPEPGDIILQKGLRMAVIPVEDGFIRIETSLIRLLFSRPVCFVELSQRNARLLRDKLIELTTTPKS